jgi:hypothetical protein
LKHKLFHGTSSKLMTTIRDEGLFPYIDLTYPDKIAAKIPVVYLAEYELSAKLYAYCRCYGTEIKHFLLKKQGVNPSSTMLNGMMFFPSEGGFPEVATIDIEIMQEGEYSPLNCTVAVPFSYDLNSKEYMVFRIITPQEIVSIEPVTETLNEVCKRYLGEASSVAIVEAAKYKKEKENEALRRGIHAAAINFFDVMELIAKSPDIDDYIASINKR